jgi:hypothetical protein
MLEPDAMTKMGVRRERRTPERCMMIKPKICAGMVLAVASYLLVGCTTVSDEAIAAATNYTFPQLKYAAEASYSLTKAEPKVALRELRRRGDEVLYEVIAAQDGSITKIRPIKSLPGEDGDFFTIGFMQQLQARKLKPSHMSAPYRTFFFPLNVRLTTEFLGSDGFID